VERVTGSRASVLIYLNPGDLDGSALVRDLGIDPGDPADLIIMAWGAPGAVAELIKRLPTRSLGTQAAAGLGPDRPGDGSDRVPPPAPPAGWFDLTARELAVASFAGVGLTDLQIGRRLHISPHTVNYHLRNIFRKLSVNSRVQLAHLLPAGAVDRERSFSVRRAPSERESPWARSRTSSPVPGGRGRLAPAGDENQELGIGH
jgi:DNA-binding CsgD family transcriptional regulator